MAVAHVEDVAVLTFCGGGQADPGQVVLVDPVGEGGNLFEEDRLAARQLG